MTASKEPTSAAASIRAAGDRSAYDANAKNLLSHRIFLAWILWRCVPEFTGVSLEKIMRECIRDVEVGTIPVEPGERIVGENTEDAPPGEGVVRFDIRFTAMVPGAGEEIALVINVEMQKNSPGTATLEKRAVIYGARLLSSQINTVFSKGKYGDARKVYTIWICTNPKNEKKNKKETHRLCQEGEFCQPGGSDGSFDLLSIVMLYLGEADKAGDEPILQLLDVVFSSAKPEEKIQTLERDFSIPMTKEIEAEVKEMGGMGQAIYESGRADGVILAERANGASDEQIVDSLITLAELTREEAWERLAEIDAGKPGSSS